MALSSKIVFENRFMLQQAAQLRRKTVTEEIQRVVETVPGWTPPDQLLALHMLTVLTASLHGDVLEIGSWCGRSTSVLGHAAKTSGDRIWAVDLFPRKEDWQRNPDGSYSIRGRGNAGDYTAYTEQTVWEGPFVRDILPVYNRSSDLLEVFKATMAREDLQDVVTPFRGDVRQWAEMVSADVRLRLAFVDGDHGYDAVMADIATIEARLLPGAWISFDDAFSHYDGVNRAIEEAIILSPHYDCAHQICRKFFAARFLG